MTIVQDYLQPDPACVLFSDAQWLQAALAFESALAMAQADCGLIPRPAALAIEAACQQVRIDRTALVQQAADAGALGVAVIQPLRQWLARHRPEGVDWLHWGTTTQDLVDTAQVLLTRQALGAIGQELSGLLAALTGLARKHASTAQIGRSLLQPAQPTTFGLKCAQAAAAVARSLAQLRRLAQRALCVQLGGAVGHNVALGARAHDVEQRLASRLGLASVGYSWHTQRDAWLRLAMEAAVCCGTLVKLAKDWALMSQFEVGEVSEALRGATSSAMPHKRNPVFCMQAIAHTQAVPQLAATLLDCMAQAHERGLGQWQLEVAQWGRLWQHLLAAASALRAAGDGLEVHPARMRAHIDRLQGVIHSEAVTAVLVPLLGKTQAQALVVHCCSEALEREQPLVEMVWGQLQHTQPAACSGALRQALHAASEEEPYVQAAQRCSDTLLAEVEAMLACMESIPSSPGRC